MTPPGSVARRIVRPQVDGLLGDLPIQGIERSSVTADRWGRL